jgi:hypothetical protein
MLSNSYLPYPETQFTYDKRNARLSVESPWVQLQVDIDHHRLDSIGNVIEGLGDPERVQRDPEIQDFLKFFADMPLVHCLPRALAVDGHYHSTAAAILGSAGPADFMASINVFPAIDVASAFAYMPRHWEWDDSDIAAQSQVPGTDLYDPFSAYTALRRKRLLFQTGQAQDAHALIAYLNTLKHHDEGKFFEAMAIVLSQQYYVTGQCHACLDPAASTLTVIGEEIRAYANEEINHDRLILRSIEQLVKADPSHFTYMPEVQLEIEVIKYAAQHCALGFSTLVSIMEGTVYPASDPVGDILRNTSRPDSHKGVEAHFQINKQGNHTAIPETFVARLPAVSRDTVRIATLLTECTIRLDAGLAGSLHRYLVANGFALPH